MGAEILLTLGKATLLSSIAILSVAMLRPGLRKWAGARAAYWLWLLVPAATLTLLLPAPSQLLLSGTIPSGASISALVSSAVSDTGSLSDFLVPAAVVTWLAGVGILLVVLMMRQRAFVRSLGSMVPGSMMPGAPGIFRSEAARVPMLIGLFRTRIVLPSDFELRYASREQELVLAHERAHERRRDLLVNTLASVSLCVFWFNPLMYLALNWLRRDQELACDEHVLSTLPGAGSDTRHVYADALLKTQLAAESSWRMPIGCHWQSIHPLKERIAMLKKPFPGIFRRTAGLALILGLAATTIYLAWAGQSAVIDGPTVLVDLKVTINSPDTNEVNSFATRYLVKSGEEVTGGDAKPLDFVCTPYVTDAEGRTTDPEWLARAGQGIPMPSAGQILLRCVIREGGNVVQSPALIIGDGKQGRIETTIGVRHFRLDITATTSAAKISDAKQSATL